VYSTGEILTGVAFVLLCVSVSVQVFSRYIFNHAFAWGEEFPVFIFLWVGFLAAAVAYRDGGHLSVDFIADRFPMRVQRFLVHLNLSLSLLFMIALAYYEGQMISGIRDSTFVVMKISKAFCYIGIPVSCMIFIAFIVEKWIRHSRKPAED
jgi:TRAP-type C4-dicarboxylate transport system permease small subunit